MMPRIKSPTASHSATMRRVPYFSVSQSEAGFEKIMQAVTLHLNRPVAEIKQGLAVTNALNER